MFGDSNSSELQEQVLDLTDRIYNSWVNWVRATTGNSFKHNRPFLSYLLPPCQNESLCETIYMKMSFTCMSIFMQIKHIFI